MAASTEVVYTEAETEAMMDDTVRNPTSNEARVEVHMSLVFDGVTMDPGAIMDAVKTLGTTQTDKIPAGGNYSFIIT
jgi:hypothetical protein